MTDLCAGASGGEIGRVLQFLPLVHEIPDLPHQRLMALDNGPGRFPIVVEPGRRHGLLELANRTFDLRDSGLEAIDGRAPLLVRAPPSPGLGLRPPVRVAGPLAWRTGGLGVGPPRRAGGLLRVRARARSCSLAAGAPRRGG